MIIALVVVLQFVAIYQADTLAGLTTKMYRHPLTVSNAVLEINSNMILMHRYMKDVERAQNNEDLETAISNVNANEAQVFEKFDLILERFLGDKSVVKEALKAFTDWQPIRAKVIELTRAGNQEQAAAITKGKEADHVAILTKKINLLIEFARNKAVEFKSHSEKVHTQSRAILYGMMFAVLVVGGLVSAFVIIKVKAWDKRLLESQNRLRQAQRMEAIGQLTGGVAHDFNNLLAIMGGNTEMLEDRVGDDEKAKHHIEALTKAVDRASSLTERLLAFSRQQSLVPTPTDISGLVNGLDDMLRRTLGETIDLRTEPSDLWPAMIDPSQFENALVNLAVNARDAMPRGGTLTIETANVTLDETYAGQHEEVTPGDYVLVAVSDTGTGMSPGVLEKVFEPFFTTKGMDGGSGLGLSMVYGFVKQSNGHITIYSEVGHGTTIKLYVPRSQEAVAKEDTKDATPEVARGSERILVVEDDESVREVPVDILRNQGYEIVEAGDGKEAIKHLKHDQPIDLLFTDVILPGGMSGVEIAEQAMRLQPNIKVIYTTGYATNAVVHNGKLGPGVTLVNKPYRRAELLEKVRAVLDGEEG